MAKELTKTQGNYAALSGDMDSVQELVQANLGGEILTPADLERVRLPSGGGIAWEIPTLDGEPDTARTIEGIIVHWKVTRAYWSQTLEDAGQAPPDCRSDDGIVGIGDPGGNCATCPLNQWNTAQRGTGKACQERRLLFILTPDSLLPIVVQAPATSIKPLKQYFLRLASRGIPYYAVTTRLGLEKATNDGGITYARIVPSMAGHLDDETRARVQAYAEGIKPSLDAVRVPHDEEPWGE